MSLSAQVASVAMAFAIPVCGGGEQPPAGEAATPSTPPAAMGFGASTITPQLVALGDSVFHGKVAFGTCVSCHGEDATGPTGVAPNLTDSEWLHSDGSWEGIFKTVQAGVLAPLKFPGAMLPMGGSGLTPDQLRAVTAYVYSLSHKIGS